MSVSNVIKSAMQRTGTTRSYLAAALDTTPASLSVKFTRSAWAADDVIRAAAAMGFQLVLVGENGLQIPFTLEDAAPPRRSGAKE